MFTLAKLTVVISKPYKYLVYLGGNLCLKFMKTVNGKIHIKKLVNITTDHTKARIGR